MLSAEQIAARKGKLTASMVSFLMTGDREKTLNAWRLLIGDPGYRQDDLSLVWPVQLGSVTEELNLRWYEIKTGRKPGRLGEVVLHSSASWAACTLDGWDDAIPCPIECKHVGGFEPRSRIIQRYLPQTHWQMIITDTRKCVLSIIEGAKEPVLEVIEYDQAYGAELWRRATAFMECVRTLTPPCAFMPAEAPVKPEKVYDFTGNNVFASEAVVWIETYRSAKRATAAEKAIKALVPADAVKCTGHGVVVARDARGYLSLREAKS